jgi:hypothetical protein
LLRVRARNDEAPARNRGFGGCSGCRGYCEKPSSR